MIELTMNTITAERRIGSHSDVMDTIFAPRLGRGSGTSKSPVTGRSTGLSTDHRSTGASEVTLDARACPTRGAIVNAGVFAGARRGRLPGAVPGTAHAVAHRADHDRGPGKHARADGL